MYDLLIDLLNEKTNIFTGKKQNEIIQKIEELKDFILLEEESIIKKLKTKTQRKFFLQHRKVF